MIKVVEKEKVWNHVIRVRGKGSRNCKINVLLKDFEVFH